MDRSYRIITADTATDYSVDALSTKKLWIALNYFEIPASRVMVGFRDKLFSSFLVPADKYNDIITYLPPTCITLRVVREQNKEVRITASTVKGDKLQINGKAQIINGATLASHKLWVYMHDLDEYWAID